MSESIRMEDNLKEVELRVILTKLNTVYRSVPYGYDTPKSMKISHQNRRQTKTIFRYMPEPHLAIFVTIVILKKKKSFFFIYRNNRSFYSLKNIFNFGHKSIFTL